MDKIYETSAFIQEYIVEKELLPNWYNTYTRAKKYPFSFYVHQSLITKLEKRLNEMFPRDDWEMYEKILQFGNKQLDMYNIIIARGSIGHLESIYDLINSSQHSFPLEENPTLFIKASDFYVMEEFIRDHQLEPYIMKTEEIIGISTEDVTIKVVTLFNQTYISKFYLIEAFDSIFIEKNMVGQYLYMTHCLPWERETIMRKGHIDDNVCEVFPIILQHLETINYPNQLNIYDLLSLRLAVSDVRDSLQSSFMKSEIDFIIRREIAKYIKNNIFDLNQYLSDKNCEENLNLRKYLVYEFQDCVTNIRIQSPLQYFKL